MEFRVLSSTGAAIVKVPVTLIVDEIVQVDKDLQDALAPLEFKTTAELVEAVGIITAVMRAALEENQIKEFFRIWKFLENTLDHAIK